MPIRIGLLGMYSSANLGDTAIQTVVMAALHSRRRDIQFVGLCPDPEDAVSTHGIPSFPISGQGGLRFPKGFRFADFQWQQNLDEPLSKAAFLRRFQALRNIGRQMRTLDMLIISGGGQIDDFWGGPWQQPFRLYAWCMFARLQRKPVAWFAVGMDELGSRLSRWFVTKAMAMSQLRTFRDAGSLIMLGNTGLTSVATVCPDPGFAFRACYAKARAVTRKKSKFVVISPISRRAFSGSSNNNYDAYLGALARSIDELQQQGFEVKFACSQTNMDPAVVLRVIARTHMSAGVEITDNKTVDDFVHVLSGAELVIASRLHALILSLSADTPVIAISPARKVRQMMIDIGLEDYYLDLKGFHYSDLISRVQSVLLCRHGLKTFISSRVATLREDLEVAFDELAAVLFSDK